MIINDIYIAHMHIDLLGATRLIAYALVPVSTSIEYIFTFRFIR